MALAALRREVRLNLPGLVEREARARLVATAKAANLRVLREQKARIGYEPAWTGFGDAPGRPVEAAERMVVYHYTYRAEIIAELLKALRAASPLDSGRYRKSHGLYRAGVLVADDTPLEPGDEVFISNPVPYARRLEVGRTESGRDFLISVPNRIYERTAKKFAARYANTAKITFGYVEMPDAWIIKGGLKPSYQVNAAGGPILRRRRQPVGARVRAPTIFVEMLR